MRLLVVTATVQERDAVLEPFPPARLARLLPYAATRVAQSGAGTLVVLPCGPGVAAAAAATAVAVNRITPDAVVTVGTSMDSADTVAGPVLRVAGDEVVLSRLLALLPEAAVQDLQGPLAEGALVAAAAHGRPMGQLTAPDLAALTAAATRAFGGEWPGIPRRPAPSA